MSNDAEYYGSPESVAAMKRSAALWSLLRDDPRFAFYGRLVGLSQPVENTAEVLGALARLQGGSPCYFFPKRDVPALFSELESAGLSTDRHEHFFGDETAYVAAKAVLSDTSLPSDLTVQRLDEATPGSFVKDAVTLMESCGVMPVPAAYLRGKQGRGLCLVATDADGKPVAVATSIFMHPAGGPHAKTVFWGMLATRPDRRGQKIALILGAQAIVHMWEREGARGFMTGVRQDNASSASLCNRLGVTDTDWTYAVCVDPQTLGRKSVTK
ncbi:GNAT family N-acetyltransferase [Roseibium aggregatum]|uniref:GNAT family N-acetyltransferase n=1 Tax=Roseibium aggregatum TaxID=187304 RepID=A0A926S5B1_9HYPH|nr:GNAT family N-acetyltransferase [Roseibium aggregatum]MBD1545965.1 GNAT family N-acetyltransferase [Roseibium aggregatum]